MSGWGTELSEERVENLLGCMEEDEDDHNGYGFWRLQEISVKKERVDEDQNATEKRGSVAKYYWLMHFFMSSEVELECVWKITALEIFNTKGFMEIKGYVE